MQPMLRLYEDALSTGAAVSLPLQAYLGHKNIQHTMRYTELSPTRFKDFCRDRILKHRRYTSNTGHSVAAHYWSIRAIFDIMHCENSRKFRSCVATVDPLRG